MVGQAAQQLGINQANSTADIAMKAAQTAATVTSAKKTQKKLRQDRVRDGYKVTHV